MRLRIPVPDWIMWIIAAAVNATDLDDWTAPMYAALPENMGMVKYLVSQGADINPKNNESNAGTEDS